VTKYAVWDVLLALAGTVYVGLVLFKGIESPIFAGVFVVLAGCELKRWHSMRSRH
jgi:hypothetical protein